MEIANININNQIPKHSLILSELVKKGYNINKLVANSNGINEEHIVKFLSDNFQDPDVKKFLTAYYDQYRVDSDKVMIISDTHLGGIYGNYDLVYWVYDFALKNGIKYILHAGDIIEGYVNRSIESPIVYEQVKELQEKYPRTDEIKTYYILGNHDYFWTDDKIHRTNCDILYVKNSLNEVKNLIYTGVLKTYINFYDEHRIMLYHSNQYGLRYPNLEHDLILKGHGHGYCIDEKNNIVHLPSLCKNTHNKNINSGFIVLSLLDNSYEIDEYRFNNGNFHKEGTKKLVYKK